MSSRIGPDARTDGVPVRIMCNPGKGTAHIRHWFTAYGSPGDYRPVCVRPNCDAPNPKKKGIRRIIAAEPEGLRMPGEPFGT